MDVLFLKILNMSTIGAWLILAVIILRLFLHKAPSVLRGALWAVVTLRLVCPFSWQSPFSLVPSSNTFPETFLYAVTPSVQTGLAGLDNVINPALLESFQPHVTDSANPSQVWSTTGSVVWLVGIALLLLYALYSALRVRYLVRAATPLRDRIWICDHLGSPFILGLFRPRIYLPSDLSQDQTAHVLAHEESHLKRLDHWWKPLGFLVLALHWFNPLVWVAYILLCRDIEFACDEKVIKNMSPDEKKAYSEALLTCSTSRRVATACPLAFGEVGVKQRIRTVLRYIKPAKWVVVTALAVLVLFTVGFTTDPIPAQAPHYCIDSWAQTNDRQSEKVVTDHHVITYTNGVPYLNFYLANRTGRYQFVSMWYNLEYKPTDETETYTSCRIRPRFLVSGFHFLADRNDKRVSYNMAPFDLSRPGVYRFSFGNPFDPCSFTFRLRELEDGEKIYNGIAAISVLLTFDEMLETHPYVVRGTISRYGDSVLRGTHACTQKYIRVSEVFRGNIAVGDEICFFDFGGETDTHSTTISPPSNFELGTESYFFISEDGLALPYLWTGDQFGDFLRERLAALNL